MRYSTKTCSKCTNNPSPHGRGKCDPHLLSLMLPVFYPIGQTSRENTFCLQAPKGFFVPKWKGKPSKLEFPNSAAGISWVRSFFVVCCPVHCEMVSGIPGPPLFCYQDHPKHCHIPLPRGQNDPNCFFTMQKRNRRFYIYKIWNG